MTLHMFKLSQTYGGIKCYKTCWKWPPCSRNHASSNLAKSRSILHKHSIWCWYTALIFRTTSLRNLFLQASCSWKFFLGNNVPK